MKDNFVYAGRFAPSPTGPLHFGSLVAALASFLDARRANGRWLLRIEDLDPPRESATAASEIIKQLKAFGLLWDDEILYQSTRLEAYQSALDTLIEKKLVYPCTCPRRSYKGLYPGRCRARKFNDTKDEFAIRLKVNGTGIEIEDRLIGKCSWLPGKSFSDFIIKRKDGLFAYQLAVVVDDAYQGITDIVRGSDLLDSTPNQIYLGQILAYPDIRYCHIPVILGEDGTKLSKQTGAEPVDGRDA
ncbi:MAG: tRNA glutamyl-Q(34) synthetase GluQRS, partial [Pseudomonadales bacterium]